MLLVIDNYDSFVFNIVHTVGDAVDEVQVVRNDKLPLDGPRLLGAKWIIISPGPMSPNEAGCCTAIIRRYSGTIPILGICLGHQCIGSAFGWSVKRHPRPTHGKRSEVNLASSRLYVGLPPRIAAGRYHSLCVERPVLERESELVVNATLDDGTIMGVEHCEHPTFGVQFHPESVLTAEGAQVLRNFINCVAPAREQA